jgi:hypothetical protein
MMFLVCVHCFIDKDYHQPICIGAIDLVVATNTFASVQLIWWQPPTRLHRCN